MIRERFQALKDFGTDIVRIPIESFRDFRNSYLADLAKKLVKDPTPEEKELFEFAADLIRDELLHLGALNERVTERAEKMGPDMVKISQVPNLGSGAGGHHDRKAELVRLAQTDDVHRKLEIVIHEFIHHMFIQIRRGRYWMGVDEGVVEGLTQHILRKYAARIFERYPSVLPYGEETPMERRLDMFWQVRMEYPDQVDTVRDVISVLAKHEQVPYEAVRDDVYRTFLGVLSFRTLARRVERAGGEGMLRLLRNMASVHERLDIARDVAERTVPHRISAATYVNEHESLPLHTSVLTVPHADRSALPNSGVLLGDQYKYMRTRFIADAERLLREGPPFNATDTEILVRALKNIIMWRKEILEVPEEHWKQAYTQTRAYRENRAAFKKRYDKVTRALVSNIRATLRDSTRLTREVSEEK